MSEFHARSYTEGLVDGMRLTLKLALGESPHGLDGYYRETDSLPESFKAWALKAMANLDDPSATDDAVRIAEGFDLVELLRRRA